MKRLNVWRWLLKWRHRIWERLLREAEHPHKISLGVAVGVAISFLPIPGFGLVISALVAWIVRANVAAAMIGQVVGNPWTFPFIWWGSYELGDVLWHTDQRVDWQVVQESLTWSYVMEHGEVLARGLLIPMTLGGVILGGIFGVLSYVFIYRELEKVAAKKRALERGH